MTGVQRDTRYCLHHYHGRRAGEWGRPLARYWSTAVAESRGWWLTRILEEARS